MNQLTDRDEWDMAVAAVSSHFAQLVPAEKSEVCQLGSVAYAIKQEMHTIVAAANAGSICAGCGGECCRTGKYHFTLVELLVYLINGEKLFTPRFDQQSGCPYLGPEGCLMAPPFRPYNCVTFNCGQIEDLLAPDQIDRLSRLEGELRQVYQKFETHFGRRLMGGLLMGSGKSPLHR